MSENIKLGTTRIRYEGIFDWNELYNLIHGWMKSHAYLTTESKHEKKPETYGNKLTFGAEGIRKESGYVKHSLSIKIKIYHMEEVDIVKNNQKQKKDKTGMMVIDITPELILDWQNKWKGSFKEKARKFSHDYLIKGRIEEWKEKLYYEVYGLHTQIKDMLNLEAKYSAY